MISEFFANSPREFLIALNGHPTAARHNSDEWAYPASACLDYRGNEFLFYGVPSDHELSRWVDDNLTTEDGTVEGWHS